MNKIISIILSISIIYSADIAYVISISGTIDMGLPHYIERSIDVAESDSAAVIVFDIDTFGGRVDAATSIKDIIMDTRIPTAAFINKRAISAGALISLSCDYIFMTPGGSIGAATAVDIKGEKASEKVISYMREEMASSAEANNRSREIAQAMVDESLSIDFIISSDGDTISSKQVEGFLKGKLITLSTKSAILLGIADLEVITIDDIFKYLNIKSVVKKYTQESWSEKLVRFLTNPVVAPLFMSIGMLALFMEIKSPGLGLPGITGVICLGLFFGSHFLVGLADVTELIILFSGLSLLILELFIIPGFGIAGIMGVIFILYSFFEMLIGNYPTPSEYKWAYFGLSIGIITSIISSVIIYKALPQTEFYKKLIPFIPQKSTDGYTISKGYDKLIGIKGAVETDLRPSGKISVNGKIYHARSHGDYISKDEKIVVDGIDENQLLVKKV